MDGKVSTSSSLSASGMTSQPVKAVACSIVRSQSLGVGDYKTGSTSSPSITRRPSRGSLKLKKVQPVVDPRSGKTATPTARHELHVPEREGADSLSPNPTSPPRHASPALLTTSLASRRCNSVGSVADEGRSGPATPVQPPASNIARSSSDVGPRGVYCPQIRRVRLEDLSSSPMSPASSMDGQSRTLSQESMLYMSGRSAVRRCESPGPGGRILRRVSLGARARPESPSVVTLYAPHLLDTPPSSSLSISSSSAWSSNTYSSTSSASQSPTRLLLREIDDICDELDHINVISHNINTLASTDEDSYAWMEGRKPGDVKYLPGTPAQSPKQRWFFVRPPEGATVVKPISFRVPAETPVKATIPSTDPTHWDLPTRGPSAFKSGNM